MSIVIIAGATGCGKSRVAVELAESLKKKGIISEIINADSMQVYNGLRTLTAQPSTDQCKRVPHNLYSVVQPDQKMNVVTWNKMATELIDDLRANDILPIVVGGTGFYINSLIDGVPQVPEVAPEIREFSRKTLEIYGRDEFYKKLVRIDYRIEDKISKNDTQRILRAFEVFQATGRSILSFAEKVCSRRIDDIQSFFLFTPRSVNLALIDARLREMVRNGVIDEVDAFRHKFPLPQYTLHRALGYKEFCDYLDGRISLDAALLQANIVSRQYAKRQITWFKNKMQNAYQVESNGTAEGLRHVVDMIEHEILQNLQE